MKNLLVLNKKTIAKLNENQLTAIKGGKNNGKAPIECNCKTCTVVIIIKTKIG